METSEQKKLGHILNAAPLEVVVGTMELARVNAKHPGVFVEVLKDRRRVKEL